MNKLIVIANLGRIRPLKFKPAGDDPLDRAHWFEDPGSTLELRPKSIHEVVTDQAGRFRQSGPLDRQGGMSSGEEHHLKAELEHQALERIAEGIGGIVAAAGFPSWRLVFPQEMLPSLLKVLPAEASRVLSGVVPGDLTKLPLAELEKRFINSH